MDRFAITNISVCKNDDLKGGYSYNKFLIEDRYLKMKAIMKIELYDNGNHYRIDIERQDAPVFANPVDKQRDDIYWVDSSKDMLHFALYGEDFHKRVMGSRNIRVEDTDEIVDEIIDKNRYGEGRLD
jgi:hypothetical protein